jgi:uncharacterized protein YlxW (UPF0749 family)
VAVRQAEAFCCERETDLLERIDALLNIKRMIEQRIAEVKSMDKGDDRDAAASELEKVIKIYRQRARELQDEAKELDAARDRIQKKHQEVEGHYA